MEEADNGEDRSYLERWKTSCLPNSLHSRGNNSVSYKQKLRPINANIPSDDGRDETMAREAQGHLFARERRDYRVGGEEGELKTGHQVSKREKDSTTLFLRVKTDLRFNIDRSVEARCVSTYIRVFYSVNNGVQGLPRRCATQDGPIGTKRKE